MKLIRISILVVCGAVLISCGGAEERKSVYLAKAETSMAAADYDKARIELRNVLQIDPKDAFAYYKLGTVYHELKDYRKAYVNYLKAAELDPNLLANQARLGNIFLYLSKDKVQAQEKIDFILKQDPEDVDGLLLKAGMALMSQKKSEAIDIAKAIVDKKPGHFDSVRFLATLYASEKNYTASIEVLDKALSLNEGNVKLSGLLANVLVANEDYDRAEILYNKTLEDNPDSRASYSGLAKFYSKKGDKAKAEQILRDSIENDPEDLERYYALVKYINLVRGEDEAIEELRKHANANINLGELSVALAEYLVLNNWQLETAGKKEEAAVKQQEAISIYKRVIADFSESSSGVNARLALATIYRSKGDAAEANNLIEEAIEISPNNPKLNFVRAQLALQNNDIEKAIIALRIVTKEAPENIKAYFLLVNAYEQQGNQSQINSTLNSAFDNNRMNADALLELSKYHINKDIGQSEKIIDEYNNLKESDYDGMSVKAAILNQKGLNEDAFELAKTIISEFPTKPNGYLLTAPYYKQINDTAKAISVLEQGYINTEDNRKILLILSSLQAAEKQFDVVEKRLLSELAVKTDDNVLKLLLAKVYIADKELAKAKSYLGEIVDSASDIEEAYLLLAQIVNDSARAKAVLMTGKDNVPSSMQIPLRLASVYTSEKDYSKAIDIYRDLYKQHPDNLIIINNLASMLSDYSDNKEDAALVMALVDILKVTKKAVFLDTAGWAYYKQANYEEAINYLGQAVEKRPNVNVFNFHLGMAYKQKGNSSQAKSYLEKSLLDGKPFAEKELAESALQDI